jgi:probable HAF family extracellular repeat protein
MGSMNVDLGTLGANNSVAYSINNAGDAIGMSELSNGAHHAFIVANALGGTVRMMDLNTLKLGPSTRFGGRFPGAVGDGPERGRGGTQRLWRCS